MIKTWIGREELVEFQMSRDEYINLRDVLERAQQTEHGTFTTRDEDAVINEFTRGDFS